LDKSLLSTGQEIKLFNIYVYFKVSSLKFVYAIKLIALAMRKSTHTMSFSEGDESSGNELDRGCNYGAAQKATIFVGNLNGCIMRADLANHFQQFGKIVSIVLPTNRPFYAFVQFSKVEEAEAALNHGLRQSVRDFIHEINLNNACKTNEVQISGWVNCDERNTANLRERKRMSNINMAFEKLRCCVPQFPFEKRLSKIDILWLAIAYMGFLDALLTIDTNVDEFIRNLGVLHHAKQTSQPSWLTSEIEVDTNVYILWPFRDTSLKSLPPGKVKNVGAHLLFDLAYQLLL
ncbi:Helix-loop-helix protein 13, partial [Trichinella nativa]